MDFEKEFEKNLDGIISDLRGLIKIPSVAGSAEGVYPFGTEVHRAFEYMLDLGKSMGFSVKNVDNYGGHIDFQGSEDGIMAIVGHIDVVPEGDGWTYEPFGGQVVDGCLYGRGAQDDKGPTIIGLYAMKILKDLGFKPRKTVRLILGLDEEANWDGMRYYLEHEKTPDFGIVPDADFPLVQCEKGLLEFDLVRAHSGNSVAEKNNGCILETFEGGSAPNVVAGNAFLRIEGEENALKDTEILISERAAEKGYNIKTQIENMKLTVKVVGKTAHAACPERGKNAISMAMDLIRGMTFANENANALLKFYNDKIGFELDGKQIGCAMEDDLSGNLTFNVGKIIFNSDEARITVDIRYPVTKSREAVVEHMEPIIAESGFYIEVFDHIRSIYQEPDNPIVITLLDTYRKISGDTESKPTVIGGATFARAIPNCMAFGALFSGDLELEHQKDEAVKLSQLLRAGHIYAEAIYRLAGEGEVL